MKPQTLALYALLTTSALATPSGLNNIPTADTVPHRTVALQAFDTFSTDSDDFWLGFKAGWDFTRKVHLELGLDSHLSPDPAGPLFFQAKLGFEPWEGGKIAIGVANVGLTDRDRAGDPFTYAVLTQDLKVARLTAGYGMQTDANTVLLGIDRTFKVFDRNLNLNADIVQIRDESAWLPSVGAKFDLTKHIVLESWVNFPEDADVSVMAKINFVFSF